ncbi:MAG: TlyA family RNA methyltransferase [bacterium]|nr:TlyA family RNA methyltransferase [bacterium]
MKLRLDMLLVERGLAETRNKAQALVMSGNVYVNGQRVDKAGTMLRSDVELQLQGLGSSYVGRGGEKISPMFSYFTIAITNRIAVDIGASTGGFTDYLLQNGIGTVYAIDSGRNQLHSRLRNDSRVIVMERTNARYLECEMFPQLPDLAVMDVSFISVRKILPALWLVLPSGSDALILVKPQFELERRYIEKGGVVRNEEHQMLAVELVASQAVDAGIEYRGYCPSPLTGSKKGNQEYFLHFHVR